LVARLHLPPQPAPVVGQGGAALAPEVARAIGVRKRRGCQSRTRVGPADVEPAVAEGPVERGDRAVLPEVDDGAHAPTPLGTSCPACARRGWPHPTRPGHSRSYALPTPLCRS